MAKKKKTAEELEQERRDDELSAKIRERTRAELERLLAEREAEEKAHDAS